MNTSRKIIIAVLLAILVPAAAAFAVTSDVVISTMTGDQETPPVSTSATGAAVFRVGLFGARISYTLSAAGLSSAVTGAHLHCAAPGQAGPVIVPLRTTGLVATSTGTSTGSFTRWSILRAARDCDPSIRNVGGLLRAVEAGRIYVNIHTAMHPQGEIRGQLGNATSTPITPAAATSTVSTTTQSGTNWYYVFVRPDSYFKNPGSGVQFSGTHFVPGETVTIRTNNSVIGTVSANSNGTFATGLFDIPYMNGSKTYTFTGSSSGIAFPVNVSVGPGNPWIVLSNYYAGAGAPVTITGHQFGSGENVAVTFNGVNVGTAKATANGDFSLSTSVPAGGRGQWSVTARGVSTGMTASQSFSQAF